MAHDIRPEVSQKNPFWIGKHRYYELKHFCLQYPIWKRARSSLDGLSKRPADLQVFVKSGQMKGDPTERCAQSRLFRRAYGDGRAGGHRGRPRPLPLSAAGRNGGALL